MGKVRLSFALMLLAALVVLLAGGRLARRQQIDRKEVNRALIHPFENSLQKEVQTINRQLEEHLGNLLREFEAHRGSDARELLLTDPALRAVYLFRQERRTKEWVKFGERDFPDVVSEGGKDPLNPETAIVFRKEFFDSTQFGESDWIVSGDERHRAYWHRSFDDVLVVLLLDGDILIPAYRQKLSTRISPYLQPLKEGGEFIHLEFLNKGLQPVGHANIPDRSAAMVNSIETPFGPIWMRARNQLSQRTIYHRPTIFGASILALILAAVGVLLYLMQSRVAAEAEQRVSFVNRVSHELGTPLTNMTLNLELAARTLRTQPEAAGVRLEKVREEVARLSRLVTNVLTYSRQDRKALQEHRVSCSPDEVIKNVITQFRPALERRHIEIEWRPGEIEEVKIDSDSLSQIVWNLISNVEKYASSGGWLGVSTGLHDGILTVKVRDWGEGISDKQRDNVFKAFERVHQTTTEGVSGTGLGLNISRDLARIMGGKLSLIDSSDSTTFQLTIPIDKL